MKLNKLQKKISISFKDDKLLIQALTHKSFDTKNNYEKLEFLGDRVLGFVISKKLLELYPNEKVGMICLLYTSPSPRDLDLSRMPSSA